MSTKVATLDDLGKDWVREQLRDFVDPCSEPGTDAHNPSTCRTCRIILAAMSLLQMGFALSDETLENLGRS